MKTRSDLEQGDTTFLTAKDLVVRYNGQISVKTLANWRSIGRGPAYTKIGGRVLYSLLDVQDWEAQRQITPNVPK